MAVVINISLYAKKRKLRRNKLNSKLKLGTFSRKSNFTTLLRVVIVYNRPRDDLKFCHLICKNLNWLFIWEYTIIDDSKSKLEETFWISVLYFVLLIYLNMFLKSIGTDIFFVVLGWQKDSACQLKPQACCYSTLVSDNESRKSFTRCYKTRRHRRCR